MPETSNFSRLDTKTYRILVLSKRQYMSRDLLDDRYGRFREIPLALAGLGHHVTGLCLSYRPRPEIKLEDVSDNGIARVSWQSLNLFSLLPWWKSSYLRTVDAINQELQPDVVWACSDALHAILGILVSKRLGIPFVVDLYDNFESFGLTRLPGMKALFKTACRASNGLTTISHTLNDYIVKHYNVKNIPRIVLGNAINKEVFYPREKEVSRKSLGLPIDAKLIGTAGALTSNRGVNVLLKAFQIIAQDNPNIWLVVAGPRDSSFKRFHHDRLIDLSIIEQDDVAKLYSALDVAVICNIDSDFGRYCFPQKFYEIIACGTPMVVANVGEMKRLLKSNQDCLFTPNSVNDLASCIQQQLDKPSPIPDLTVPGWESRATQLEDFILSILE